MNVLIAIPHVHPTNNIGSLTRLANPTFPSALCQNMSDTLLSLHVLNLFENRLVATSLPLIILRLPLSLTTEPLFHNSPNTSQTYQY